MNAPGGSNPIQQHQKLLAQHIREAEEDNASNDTETEIQKPTTDVLTNVPKNATKTKPKKLKPGKMTDVVLKNFAKNSAKAPPVPWSKQKGKHAK